MSIQRAVASASLLAVVAALGTGCETKSFLDPSENGRYEKTPKVVPILDKLVVGTETDDVLFPSAREVTDDDLKATATDYRIGPGDLLQISIQDLAGQGLQQVESKQVSESGKISLPYLGQISAAGQTEAELQDTIVKAYADAQILPRAIIGVAVASSQNRIYTITGAVNQQGPYPIPRADFRLLDALASARDVTSQLGIDYIYIVRRKPTAGGNASPSMPAQSTPSQSSPSVDPLAPQSRAMPAGKPVWAMLSMQAQSMSPDEARRQANDLANQINNPNAASSDPLAASNNPPPSTMPSRSGSVGDRVIQIEGAGTRPASGGMTSAGGNGAMSSPAAAGNAGMTSIPPTASVSSTTAQPPISDSVPFTGPRDAGSMTAANGTTKPFEFTAPAEPSDREVIRVPYPMLRDGALKYNVVIEPQDLIVVPQPGIGEYYMGGHVTRTGVYSLTARKITLMQAVISAGMFDQLAIPARTDVIRRTGPNQQMFVRVDLERIFSGLEPDVYLKPNDQVMVGTNAGAPFLAAIRNAFRITYGFGFLYDRNYAPDNNNN